MLDALCLEALHEHVRRFALRHPNPPTREPVRRLRQPQHRSLQRVHGGSVPWVSDASPLLTALLAGLLALPASAGAATRWVVKGAGWGHGIGMSQYGAYGMAQQGSDYREILGPLLHGHRGLARGHADDPRAAPAGARPRHVHRAPRARAAGRSARRRPTSRASPAAGVQVRDNKGKKVGTFGAPLVVQSDSFRLGGTAINGVTDGTYHGNIEIRPSGGGGLTAVNAVSLDHYVQGVVPGEMPSLLAPPRRSRPSRSPRARTRSTTDKGGAVFDQYPDTRSQVYRGVDVRDRVDQRRRARHGRRGRQVRRQGRGHLLLLHLGRPHRERRERLLRRLAAAVPARRRGPAGQDLAQAPLDADLHDLTAAGQAALARASSRRSRSASAACRRGSSRPTSSARRARAA